MAYALSGLLVGILVGLTGIGGGALMTPLLVFLFRAAPGTALGTDLLFACLTKTTDVAVHGFSNTGRLEDREAPGREDPFIFFAPPL